MTKRRPSNKKPTGLNRSLGNSLLNAREKDRRAHQRSKFDGDIENPAFLVEVSFFFLLILPILPKWFSKNIGNYFSINYSLGKSAFFCIFVSTWFCLDFLEIWSHRQFNKNIAVLDIFITFDFCDMFILFLLIGCARTCNSPGGFQGR